MNKLSLVMRTLYPVDARGNVRRSSRSSSSQSTLLGQVLALCFAVTPLLVLIEAVSVTA